MHKNLFRISYYITEFQKEVKTYQIFFVKNVKIVIQVLKVYFLVQKCVKQSKKDPFIPAK